MATSTLHEQLTEARTILHEHTAAFTDWITREHLTSKQAQGRLALEAAIVTTLTQLTAQEAMQDERAIQALAEML